MPQQLRDINAESLREQEFFSSYSVHSRGCWRVRACMLSISSSRCPSPRSGVDH